MLQQFDLEGRLALITGATGGFGSRFAEVLIEQGAGVILVGRDHRKLNELRERLVAADRGRHGAPITTLNADLLIRGAGEVFDAIEDTLGAVDLLINNAGIGHVHRALEVPPSVWTQVMDVDLNVPFRLAQEMAKRLIKKRGGNGSIINIASIFGEMGSRGMIAYATAKAALIQMTQCLALELGTKNIRVNAIAPGWCMTDLTRDYLECERGATIARDIALGRFGAPDDLDGVLLLLASDAGRYITGATFVVDGGLSIALRDGAPSAMNARPVAA